jgi:hypothetical protein
MEDKEFEKPERPVEFRTTMYLTILLGIFVALLIHFILLSNPYYNWMIPS